MLPLLKLILNHLPNNYKKQFVIAFLLLLISGLAEILSIASIVPFLSLLEGGSQTNRVDAISNILPDFITNNINSLFIYTLLFAFATSFSAIVRLSSIWCNSFFSARVGSYLSNLMFRGNLIKDYEYHVNQNINKTILTLTQHINGTVRALFYLLQFFSGSIISIFIIIYLIYFNPEITFISLIIFGSYYILIANYFKLKLVKNSKSIADIGQFQIKLVRESLGGIRDIILNENSDYYSNIYKDNDKRMRYKQASNIFISIFPRYSLEAIAIITISVFGAILNNDVGIGNITIIGSIAFGAQRLLPSLQSIYSAWAMLKNFNEDILVISKSILTIDNTTNYLHDDKNLLRLNNFKEINLNNIYYKYRKSKNDILYGCNVSINQGEMVAFIGKTGSGKSTLVDIIMGLLKPTKGRITIDKKLINNSENDIYLRSWKKCIAHVPQEVFLRNESILSNILENKDAKLLNQKNKKRLEKAIFTSQVHEFINELEDGLNTLVGERGVKLSGGQKQRIGVARALIREKPLLVLDESTSALDEIIEKKMLDSIKVNYPNLTIIMITHRKSNLIYCDKVFELENGKINELSI